MKSRRVIRGAVLLAAAAAAALAACGGTDAVDTDGFWDRAGSVLTTTRVGAAPDPLTTPAPEEHPAVKDIDPFDDSHASAWYRTRVTSVHVRRALIGE